MRSRGVELRLDLESVISIDQTAASADLFGVTSLSLVSPEGATVVRSRSRVDACVYAGTVQSIAASASDPNPEQLQVLMDAVGQGGTLAVTQGSNVIAYLCDSAT